MASRMAGLLTVVLLAATTIASAQDKRLTFLDRPLLVQCRDDRPFFRVTVNAEDGQGKPVGVELGADPVSRGFRVFEVGRTDPHKVIHVSTQESRTSKGNSVLLLLDTSGSMKLSVTSSKGGPSRFAAAKDAIKQSLNGFKDGVDQIAIAQFESHDVVRRIQAARFHSTAKEIIQQVDRLDQPSGNTALYSAIVESLPILERRRAEGYSVALVVFSDGENDIGRGDDPGLLAGNSGLDAALSAVTKAKVAIFTIGFGVTGNPRVEGPLKRIAFPDEGHFRDARTDARRLTEILELVRQKLADQIRILFGPVRDTRQDLRSGDLSLMVDLTAGATTVRSQTTNVWHAPVGTGVTAETQCTEAEALAIAANAPITGSARGPWDRIIIFVTFAVVIAGLWFAAPRFVWPESYIPRPVIPPLPTTNLPPGVQGPPQPQVPTWDRMRGSGRPPAYEPPPRGSRPPSPPPMSGPPDQTVVVSPRPAARPGATPPPAPPRNVPPPREDQGRGPDDETIYIPPPKNPYRK
jgi:Mg-chelatase subunit ChlD